MNQNNARLHIAAMDDNKRWLWMHIITSFWHTFGISSGLRIPRNKVRLGADRIFQDDCIEISAEMMQELLAKWQKWLDSYAKSWNIGHYDIPQGIDPLVSSHQSWNQVNNALLTTQVGFDTQDDIDTEMVPISRALFEQMRNFIRDDVAYEPAGDSYDALNTHELWNNNRETAQAICQTQGWDYFKESEKSEDEEAE